MDREDIARLIPHQGTMCLLQRLVSWDALQVLAATRSHLASDNPLRRDGRLRAVHLCEYGAQAAALHGGLAARAAGRRAPPGMLVALRDVSLGFDFIEHLPQELYVRARQLLEDGGNCQYLFEVHHAGRQIGRGRVAIIRRE